MTDFGWTLHVAKRLNFSIPTILKMRYFLLFQFQIVSLTVPKHQKSVVEPNKRNSCRLAMKKVFSMETGTHLWSISFSTKAMNLVISHCMIWTTNFTEG